MKRYSAILSLGIAAMMAFMLSALSSCSSSTYTAPDGHVPVFSLSETPIHVKVNVDYMTTFRGRSGAVMGNSYFVELLNDSAYVYIPYFGRVYSAAPNYDGTNFDEPYTNLKVTRNKKNTKSTLTFDVRHESFVYKFTLDLWDGNSMSLNVAPNVGNSCTYSGTWEEVQLRDKHGNLLPPKY